ncbi:pancreatic lipase-related protein 2-like [Hydractinia symbiolongicarpus]|uniref:pancreatic lipase-related protein 2-like n=1 Tax=Hydractinia symbiolongicarpus TaxID=13093 RepID=UPI00254F2D1B|nr:pancreatic lipase-related protein 2-like [Hydractinia symbiolongicarpus]
MRGAEVVYSIFSGLLINEVCYPPYGCFSKKPPFDDPYYLLPNSPGQLKTKFWLHTRNITSPVNLNLTQNSSEEYLAVKKKLVVIGHGYLESSRVWWVQPMVNAFLKLEDMNIIVVDWKKGAAFPYTRAVGNSRLVGRQISYLLEKLLRKRNPLQASDIHLIGFSLGAHLMGYAGENLKEKGFEVGRITGLDPAGPGFKDAVKSARLDKTDAQFVDIIHTDTKTVYITGLGIKQAIGHVDFYPNGGYFQPGCKRVTLDLFSKKGAFDYIGCSHYRAVNYFLESIPNKKTFNSYKCYNYERFKKGNCKGCNGKNICNNMGYHTRKTNGKFYSMTRAKANFSGYHYLLKAFTGSKDYADTFGQLKIKVYGRNGLSSEIATNSVFLKHNSSYSLIMHTDKKLGEIYKVKISLVSGYWFNDAWYLKKVAITPMWNSDSYVGCGNVWINKNSEIIRIKKKSKDIKC